MTRFTPSVLPAHAGVILCLRMYIFSFSSITRTCGGDPVYQFSFNIGFLVLPAHAGVILSDIETRCKLYSITRTCGGDPISKRFIPHAKEYYPHMRG